jgi:hypothetical protein
MQALALADIHRRSWTLPCGSGTYQYGALQNKAPLTNANAGPALLCRDVISRNAHRFLRLSPWLGCSLSGPLLGLCCLIGCQGGGFVREVIGRSSGERGPIKGMYGSVACWA